MYFYFVKGKKILIAISGSIAAYKIPILVRLLIKAGAEVKIMMTPAAKDFVSPLVLSTLTKQDVVCELSTNSTWANHVMLGRWADVMLIAPASCNTIAKMAHGICDNLLLSVYLSATCPVLIAPAMDEDMYHHPSHIANLKMLESYGNIIIPSEHGELASGLVGFGRMAEVETIVAFTTSFLNKKQRLKKVKVVVSAGPTYENLDPVRFIGNHSTGKMGIAIAETLANEGCEVQLVLGPTDETTTHENITITKVTSAAQMYAAVVKHFAKSTIAVMSAAVADYTPKIVSTEKIKKKESSFTIELTKTKDILQHLGTIKKKGQFTIGFALENHDEKTYALKKLKDKNADMIVLNSLNEKGAGFGTDTNKITLFEKNGQETIFELKSKKEVAKDIVEKIIIICSTEK
jgi:phosphopantothenoylcysteine decarboxylase/phosphopantothenate--cysteine ligase